MSDVVVPDFRRGRLIVVKPEPKAERLADPGATPQERARTIANASGLNPQSFRWANIYNTALGHLREIADKESK